MGTTKTDLEIRKGSLNIVKKYINENTFPNMGEKINWDIIETAIKASDCEDIQEGISTWVEVLCGKNVQCEGCPWDSWCGTDEDKIVSLSYSDKNKELDAELLEYWKKALAEKQQKRR